MMEIWRILYWLVTLLLISTGLLCTVIAIAIACRFTWFIVSAFKALDDKREGRKDKREKMGE